jgi:hypothetical protein
MTIQRLHLRDEALRDDAMNEATRVVRQADLRPSCEEAFISHYDDIRSRCAPLAGMDGLAIVAVDEAGIAASAFLPRRREGLEVAVVGRHAMADLWLGSPSVALRHLLIVSAQGRYRVLDLRTQNRMVDERGQALRSFEAGGPVFFQVENTSFLTLPTARRLAWPSDRMAAWKSFPARTYDGIPFRHRLLRRMFDDDDEKTIVTIGPSVVDANRSLATGPLVGSIEIQSERGSASLSVDDAALHSGVLLGRYERCDTGGLEPLGVGSLSRVHALLLKVDGTVHVIDTASTNGIEVRRTPVRAHALTAGEEMILGGAVSIRWHPVH